MKKIFVSAFFTLASLIPAGLSAQSLRTGYFLDNYVYSYHFNPALIPDSTKVFVGMGADNLTVGVNSNIGLNSVLFPVTIDGKKQLVTGFNSAVSASDFLDGLKDRIRVGADLTENILSLGIVNKRSMVTVEINARMDVAAGLPKDMVSILKSGTDVPGSYSINDISASVTSFAELAIGYSYRISDNLNVGGRLKLLAGAADLQAQISTLNATVKDEIIVAGKGDIRANILNQKLKATPEGNIDMDDLFELVQPAPGGYGAALDLGAELSLPGVEGLTLSASILDLGGILWLNTVKGSADFNQAIGNEESKPVEDLFKLESNDESQFAGIGPCLNIGARYQIVKMFSVGALATVRPGRFGMAETRLGATFTPGKVFSLAASAGLNTFGTSFGCAMSLKVPGFNFYIGTDSIFTHYTPEYIPIDKLNTRLTLGLVIAI